MSDEALLRIGAWYHLAFAVFHVAFWRLFRWKTELAKLEPLNRAVMQILNLRIIYLALVFAWLSWFFTDDLLSTRLGRAMTGAIALFWAMRAVEQLIFFGVRSKRSNLFVAIFAAGAALYAIPLLR